MPIAGRCCCGAASRVFRAPPPESSGAFQERGRGNNQFCREVFAFIQSYYAHEITSRHVADKLGYTQSYFCRLFKQQFGQSFRYYLMMYRISKAKQFFDEGCRSVTQTAEKVGFHNMSYFTQVFQQYTAACPPII